MAVSISNEAPRFEFQLDGEGEVYSIPAFDDIEPDDAKDMYGANGDAAEITKAFRRYVERECPGIEITNRGLRALLKAWQESAKQQEK